MAELSGAQLVEASSLGADTAGLPGDLAAAVEAALRGDPAVSALATGGVYNGTAGDRAKPAAAPYIVFFLDMTDYFGNSGGRGHYEYWDVKFNCNAAAQTLAGTIGSAILLMLPTLRAMQFRDGYLMSFLPKGGPVGPARARGPESARIWTRTITFRAKVGRNVPCR